MNVPKLKPTSVRPDPPKFFGTARRIKKECEDIDNGIKIKTYTKQESNALLEKEFPCLKDRNIIKDMYNLISELANLPHYNDSKWSYFINKAKNINEKLNETN